MCVCIYFIAHNRAFRLCHPCHFPKGGINVYVFVGCGGGGQLLNQVLFCFVAVIIICIYIYIHIYFPIKDETIHNSTKAFSK